MPLLSSPRPAGSLPACLTHASCTGPRGREQGCPCAGLQAGPMCPRVGTLTALAGLPAVLGRPPRASPLSPDRRRQVRALPAARAPAARAASRRARYWPPPPAAAPAGPPAPPLCLAPRAQAQHASRHTLPPLENRSLLQCKNRRNERKNKNANRFSNQKYSLKSQRIETKFEP